MQPSHPYYPASGYSTNVIEVTDPYLSQSTPSTSAIFSIHHPGPFSTDPVYRKRKIERACDACRRRKTKCDGPNTPDNICTNCIQNRKTCSYVEASKPRGPPKAYITGLEDRLEKMEALLKRLRPESDFSEELGPRVVRDSWKTDPEPLRRLSPRETSSSPSVPSFRLKNSPSGSLRCSALPPVGVSNTINPSSGITSRSRRSAGTPRTDTDLSSDGYTSSDNEEIGELSLSRGMKRLTIRGLEPAQDNSSLPDSQVRFHGKSSCFKLIETTRKLRNDHIHRVTGGDERSRSSCDNASPVNIAALRRPEFWTTPWWELAFEGSQDRLESISVSSSDKFPPQDLADSLIKLYFEHVNPQFPLFHRPTFERQWKEGLQHKDPWFGCLCLALFAVTSRWSDDPRVLDDGEYVVPEAERPNEEHKWQRAGWRYFNAAVDVHRESHSLFHPPGLFEVQTMSLLGMFLRGTAFHPVAWLFISIGLRKAQDVGAHRKKIYGDKPSVEEELWKRAFWMLVLYDRIGSAALGRPCCSGEEDFDVDLPLEVDDEYWETEDAERAFQQPPDKPSKIAAFNSYLKLTKIAAYALRTIYPLDRSKLLVSAARPRWQEVLTQLNNAMTEWVDSVPKHLQWTPHIGDPLLANQSATLYITYYLIQIIIYRPFLPSSLRSVSNTPPHSSMPIPCIAICVNASKSCSRILKTQICRGLSNIPSLICSAHMCAAILLMNFWDLKWQERNQLKCDAFEDIKSPLALSMAELLEDVAVFIEALELVQPRWRNAEMYLKDLSSSLPHSLGGSEHDSRKDDQCPSKFDDCACHNVTAPEYGAPPAYRTPPVTPAITTYSYNSRVEPSASSPHFFEFPHTTRYPIPSTLPLPPSYGSVPSHASSTSQSTRPTIYQPPVQRGYDEFPMDAGSNDRKSSVSSLQPRLAPSFHRTSMDEPAALEQEAFIPQQFVVTGRMPYTASVPLQMQDWGDWYHPCHPSGPGWASEWDHNPVYAYGLCPSGMPSMTTRPGYPLRHEEINYPHGQILSCSGHY
ncbi:hypothetical protein PAXRUDRAFT_135686 [Paxillus rubicundulus Ve08.2h10]|uniref:Zn(2)-C6 fungal-type domain-containing protein n=1 Tax=Paxillus rubicundulus Ve08.2h10 TaxID=930991 RepID=A0A0D0DHK7_9AGAM|nr:hypothetical protein PAXRUDRAFT_135686 [Paxillus rubicundulus Ve08.2h10]